MHLTESVNAELTAATCSTDSPASVEEINSVLPEIPFFARIALARRRFSNVVLLRAAVSCLWVDTVACRSLSGADVLFNTSCVDGVNRNTY